MIGRLRALSLFLAVALIAIGLTLGLPAAATAAAPSISQTNEIVTGDTTVSVDGWVNPEGETTSHYVAYDLQSSAWCTSGGTSGAPTFTTTPVQMDGSSPAEDVGADLTGLNVNTEYCAELIASNSDGEVESGQVVWWQGQPRIDNADAYPTDLSTATVEADVNPGGQYLGYEVQYGPASSSWCTSGGTSGSPPNETDPESISSTDNSFHHVSVNLTGLTVGSGYCAAIFVFNGYLRNKGEQVTWSQTLPDAQTWDAYSTGGSTATVEGEVNSGGDPSTTYQVQYDSIGSDWCQSGGDSGVPADTISANVIGPDPLDAGYEDVSGDVTTELTEGQDYCAQLVASNDAGEADGGQVWWTQGSPTTDTFDANATGPTTATVDGDVNAGAQPTTYKVEYDLLSSDWCQTGNGSPAYTTAATGLPESEVDGNFHNVSVSLTGLAPDSNYCGDVVATNSDGTYESFQAEWQQQAAPPTLTVTVSGSGTGTVTSSPAGIDCGGGATACSANFPAGAQVTLTATPASGSTFGLWMNAPGCTTPGVRTCQLTMSQDVTIGAGFGGGPRVPTPMGQVIVQLAGSGAGTVTSGPAGIDCLYTCSAYFSSSALVTLTATPAPGSQFSGWSGGGCSGTGTCSDYPPMSSSVTFTATFEKSATPSPPPTKCVVPNVKGKTLAAAKRAIKSHHCTVGKIRKVASKKHEGKVISQQPKAGKHLKKGSKVALEIGK
jgi:hypothetical protein